MEDHIIPPGPNSAPRLPAAWRGPAFALAPACLAVAAPALAAAERTPAYAASEPLPEPAIFAPGIISTGDDEAHATFTADGRTLYFIKNSPDFRHWTVVVSRYTDGHWDTPEVAPFSGRYDDADVAFGPEGEYLYFISNRPVDGEPSTDTDLWRLERSGSGWSDAEHLPAVSSRGFEWFPSLTRSGVLYFGSERRQGNHGPEGTSDLWRSEPAGGGFTAPENLGDRINTAGNDIEAYVAPDERFIIFSSNGRADTRGSYDLYISYRCGGEWTEPANLGDDINSAAWDFGARLTPDGEYLFFTSNRSDFDEPPEERLDYERLLSELRSPGNGLRDIYRVDTEVLPPSPCP